MTPALSPALAAALARMREAPELVLLLDYDGTLVPFATVPSEAKPDGELLHLLGALAARAGTHVHIVSGRARAALEGWLGDMPIGLHAEHGFWSRASRTAPWTARAHLPEGWKPRVLQLLEAAAARVPGTLVEEKATCVAWHYRAAAPDAAAREAHDLRERLAGELANGPLELLDGDMVIELRVRGINKGAVVGPLLAAHPDATFAAIGDDLTDEDLFAALPSNGIAIHVGAKITRAQLRVASQAEVGPLLRALAWPGPAASA